MKKSSSQTASKDTRVALTHNDLLVLSYLLERAMHGYEISQCIKDDDVTAWFNISTAAIYYSLNKLYRQGLISETRPQDRKAEKSVYHLTEQGREQFLSNLEAALGSQEPLYSAYDLGIFLLNKLPQPRALALLEQRIEFLSNWNTTIAQAIEKILAREPTTGSRLLQATILTHSTAHAQTDIEWLNSIIQQLEGEEIKGEKNPGLMILTGNLQDHHLPNLIQLIGSGQHSGMLTVNHNAYTRTLSFQEGQPVCATSRSSDGETPDPQQTMEDIYDLFRWTEGTFSFNQYVGPKEGCLVLQCSATDLILEGTRRVENWATIQRVVPTPSTVFEHRHDTLIEGDLDLVSEERQLLETLNGLSDVTTVARECRLTEFEASRILYSLHAVGLVRPSNREKIRLRRAFRELAELTCRNTAAYRNSPEDVTCEIIINEYCGHLPIRLVEGRVEDQDLFHLQLKELVEIYQTFLQTQYTVIREQFGENAVVDLQQKVRMQISPSLWDTLEQYGLIAK